MKRLLTYGLLLLTILASHFVVSACQDDLPETTEVMMTFTTRALVTQEDVSKAIEQEQMKDLRVIMVRQNGSIVHNHKVENITESSVTVTFQTPVLPDGETFKFFAIANEGDLVPDLNLESITSGEISSLITQEVGGDAFAIRNAIPQTQYWEHHIDVQESRKESISKQLEYMASKISVQFVNQTNEAQSLENIKITGIPLATKGYLFKQADDYVDTKNAASEISFNAVTSLAAGASSAIQHYYTYPVEGITNAVLSATWKGKNGESDVTKTEPLEGITSLPRNQHLKIVITLVGPGDITVNYEVAEWIDNPTNIGNPQPNPGGGYHVDPWGDANDIIIGGSTGGQDWNLGNGTTIKGEEVQTDWEDTYGLDSGLNDVIQGIKLPNDKTFRDLQGDIILIEFVCYNGQGKNKDGNLKFDVLFLTDYDRVFSERNIIENDDGTQTQADAFAWNDKHEAKDESEPPYVRYVKLTEDVVDFIYDNNSSKQTIFNVKVVNAATGTQEGLQIALKKFKLIKPTSATNL